MKVECPGCGFSGNIKDDLIPEAGKELRCPKCKGSFFVRRETGERRTPPPDNPVPRRSGIKAIFISVGISLIAIIAILFIMFIYIPRNYEPKAPPEITEKKLTEEEILKSFELFVASEVKKGLVKKRDETIYSKPGGRGSGGWYRVFDTDPKEIKYNVERTNSLVTPYSGTITFNNMLVFTDNCQTKEEAKTSAESKMWFWNKYIYTYGFQENRWALLDKDKDTELSHRKIKVED